MTSFEKKQLINGSFDKRISPQRKPRSAKGYLKIWSKVTDSELLILYTGVLI